MNEIDRIACNLCWCAEYSVVCTCELYIHFSKFRLHKKKKRFYLAQVMAYFRELNVAGHKMCR